MGIGAIDPTFRELEGAKPLLTFRDDRLLARIPFDSLARFNDIGAIRFDCCAFDRRREANRGVAFGGVQIRDDEELAARQRLRFRQSGPAAVRKQKTSVGSARLCDSVGVGQCEQTTDVDLVAAFVRGNLSDLSGKLFGASSDAIARAPVDLRVDGAARSAAKGLEPKPQVHVALAAIESQ